MVEFFLWNLGKQTIHGANGFGNSQIHHVENVVYLISCLFFRLLQGGLERDYTVTWWAQIPVINGVK